MFASPLRDGGYDVADFYDVHPDYGDGRGLPHPRRGRAPARHPRDRGLRRQPHVERQPVVPGVAPRPDRPKRDWYVWSDTDERWQEARIIFIDTEPSNWTWDPVRGQYFWHRFFRTSPTSTTTTPRCRRRCWPPCASGSTSASTASASTPSPTCSSATARTARTSPRRTTSCSRVRAEVDAHYPDHVLLAEANQWPADVVDYFGDGRRVPHVLPLPGHAAHVHGPAPRGRDADLRDPAPDAARSPRTASGASSCATTTS